MVLFEGVAHCFHLKIVCGDHHVTCRWATPLFDVWIKCCVIFKCSALSGPTSAEQTDFSEKWANERRAGRGWHNHTKENAWVQGLFQDLISTAKEHGFNERHFTNCHYRGADYHRLSKWCWTQSYIIIMGLRPTANIHQAVWEVSGKRKHANDGD